MGALGMVATYQLPLKRVAPFLEDRLGPVGVTGGGLSPQIRKNRPHPGEGQLWHPFKDGSRVQPQTPEPLPPSLCHSPPTPGSHPSAFKPQTIPEDLITPPCPEGCGGSETTEPRLHPAVCELGNKPELGSRRWAGWPLGFGLQAPEAATGRGLGRTNGCSPC